MDFFTRFVNNLKRNFTDPVGLAQDMGKAESAANEASKTFLPSQDANKNTPKSNRFAVADYDMNEDITKGMYYTKPYEDTRTDAQKDKDERADVRAKKAAEEAKKSLITETAEEEAVVADTTPSKLETAKTNMLNKADTTQSTGAATVATEEAKKDKKKGFKGGTIVTSAQGLLSGSGDALRPKRSLLAAA
tara:strand:- start:2293 stop:2865 length:573 start_codon:yes stop_codon:yes gene_type:complete